MTIYASARATQSEGTSRHAGPASTHATRRRIKPSWRQAVDIVAQIDGGTVSAETVVDECLCRIAEREPLVKAWAWLDATAARRSAQSLPARQHSQSLYGVPVGIKDIIDTADMPTSYGSALYSEHRPATDAVVVARLRAAGAIIMGKTVTTEFAYVHPGPTHNPHHLDHTPGGSSSGSAAAVADGMVPLALGSQTGGSTIRPSAYCGVVGFKPSFAAVNMEGVRPLAPSMDAIGIHARSVADVALVYPVIAGLRQPPANNSKTPIQSRLRIGYFPGPHAAEAHADARDALERAASQMTASGMDVVPVDLPLHLFAELGAANRIIMAYEAARVAGGDYDRGREILGPSTRELIETGRGTTAKDYGQARELTMTCRKVFAQMMCRVNMLLTFSAPGEAPRQCDGTGSSIFNRAWTTIGAPCLTLPFGYGSSHTLPLGIQLVSACGGDSALLEGGARVEQSLQVCGG